MAISPHIAMYTLQIHNVKRKVVREIIPTESKTVVSEQSVAVDETPVNSETTDINILPTSNV